jgi:hypothetical protein
VRRLRAVPHQHVHRLQQVRKLINQPTPASSIYRSSYLPICSNLMTNTCILYMLCLSIL